ncbi:microfibril-associated glycoprotein 4-like [Anopheles ziemanni]|uniref:microfibril-associated glycoprotein 4-like n=1 Tax=Anopheles coustani TaxID=139045 RepID=UPI00265A68F8|nr:microfibril-associated glycoprotein 4-like [Anopheles coustani]XP_058178455.1 microfibril-associated glycoprotein 4-like [Anopheles ziemanni]
MRTVIFLVVFGVLATVSGQQQTEANNVQISGFLFELLLTHLSALEGRIQEKLDELAKNQTLQIEQLMRSLQASGTSLNQRLSGLPNLNEQTSLCQQLNVPCRVETIENHNDGRLDGSWVVLQHRFDGSLTFNRDWHDYRDGFGDQRGEHWLGLKHMHRLLTGNRHELLILLESFENETAYANYDDFRIGDESEQFVLKTLGKYSGTAGDSLKYHLNSKFSTHDQDNDAHTNNCAFMYHGGWWYKDCYASNLNGRYINQQQFKEDGLIWNSFKGPFTSMKMSKILIRPYTGTNS